MNSTDTVVSVFVATEVVVAAAVVVVGAAGTTVVMTGVAVVIVVAPVDVFGTLIIVMEFGTTERLKVEFGLVTASFSVSLMSMSLGIVALAIVAMALSLNTTSSSTCVSAAIRERNTGMNEMTIVRMKKIPYFAR